VLHLKPQGVAVLLNSHLIGEVERVCDRVVILDRGRVAAQGSLAELLGLRELRLQLTGLTPAARARLAATGKWEQEGEWSIVALPADDVGTAVPDLVADLVALGVRVHAVEPGRISLEERLLGILRVTRMLLPTDGLWRGAMHGFQDPSALVAFGGADVQAFPFLSVAPLTASYLAWVAVWVAMVWGLAAVSYVRKDL